VETAFYFVVFVERHDVSCCIIVLFFFFFRNGSSSDRNSNSIVICNTDGFGSFSTFLLSYSLSFFFFFLVLIWWCSINFANCD